MPQKPQKSELGSSELHQFVRGGERVLIRRAQPQDTGLYRDFLADVSAPDLRLRFFADIAELSAAETTIHVVSIMGGATVHVRSTPSIRWSVKASTFRSR